MKLATCYLVLLVWLSCTPTGIYVVVSNEQDIPVAQVRVSYNAGNPDDLTMPEILPHQTVYGWLSMEKTPPEDGCYQVWIQQNGAEKKYPCRGYYTNGGPILDTLYIELKKDSVLIIQLAPNLR